MKIRVLIASMCTAIALSFGPAAVQAQAAYVGSDRVCVMADSDPASYVRATLVTGVSSNIHRALCSSPTHDIRSFTVGPIPCYSYPWGYKYWPNTTYNALAVEGELYVYCHN